MGIYVRCKICKSDHKIGSKVCKKCKGNLSNNKIYKVSVKIPEGKRVVRHVDNYSLAKRVESSLKGKVAEEKDLNIKRVPLISDVWKEYENWALENKKSSRNDIGRWKLHVASHVKDKRMDQLTPIDVENIINNMKKYKTSFQKGTNDKILEILDDKPSPATKKHVLVLIKRVYNWAIKRDRYSGSNPAAKIKPPKVNNEVTEFLTRKEISSLIHVLATWKNQSAAVVVRFGLFTGLRLDEILGLEWKNIDLDKKFIVLKDPKGNPVTLPINDGAVQILKNAKKSKHYPTCEYVFPNNKGERRVSFGKIWGRIREAAGLPKDFRFHGLRHTFASYLASSGEVDIYTLQKLLNHQSPDMTQRYAHLLDEALRKGANVADKVFDI